MPEKPLSKNPFTTLGWAEKYSIKPQALNPWLVIPGLPDYVESMDDEGKYIKKLQDQQNYRINEAILRDGKGHFFPANGKVHRKFEELNKFRTLREQRDSELWLDTVKPDSPADLNFRRRVARRFLINRLDDGRIPWQSWVPRKLKGGAGRDYRLYEIPNALYGDDDPRWGVPMDPNEFPGAGKNGEDGRLDFRKHQFFSTRRALNNAFSVWNDTYGAVYKEGDLNSLIAQWNALAPSAGLLPITGDMVPERGDYPDVLVKVENKETGEHQLMNLERLENYLYRPTDEEVDSALRIEKGMAHSPEDKKEMARREAERTSFDESWQKILESGDQKLRSPFTLDEFSGGMNYWTFRFNLQRKLAQEKLHALPEDTREEFNRFGRFIWEMADKDNKPFSIDNTTGAAIDGWAAPAASTKLAAAILKHQKLKIDERDPTVVTGREDQDRETYYKENLVRVVRAVAENLQEATINRMVPPSDIKGRTVHPLDVAMGAERGSSRLNPFGSNVRLEHAQMVIDLYNKSHSGNWFTSVHNSPVAAKELDAEFVDKATQYIKMVILLENKGISTASFSKSDPPYYTLTHQETGKKAKFSYTYPLAHSDTVEELDRLHDWAVDYSKGLKGNRVIMNLGNNTHEVIVGEPSPALKVHEEKTAPKDKMVRQQSTPESLHTKDRIKHRSGRTPE